MQQQQREEARMMEIDKEKSFTLICIKVKYDSNLEHEYHHNMCLICHEDFQHEEILRKAVMCAHVFHHECIKAWYTKSATCPICKQDLSKAEMEKYYKKLRENVYADEKASK